MPIYTQAETTVVHLGYGDVLFSPAKQDGKLIDDELLFIPDDRQNSIGERVSPERWGADYAGKTSDDLKVPVRVIFDDIRSLDSLMATLHEIRDDMAQGEQNVSL